MRTRKKGTKKRTGLGAYFLLGINVLSILCLLLSYLAPYIDPQSCWPIAFFGLGYLVFLLINFLFVGLWLLKRSRFALLSVAAILLGYIPFRKHVGFHHQPDQETIQHPDSAHIRILTYNVHLFRKDDQDVRPQSKDEITELIRSVSPDIVCLQEFYTRKKGKHNIRKQLSDSLKMPYLYFHPVVENDYEAYGLIILSRFPIRNSGVVPYQSGKKTLNRMIYADIQKNKRIFRVYNIHLQSIGFRPIDYAFVQDVKNYGFEQDKISSTKRIGGRLKRAYVERSAQARRLKEEIDRCRKPLVVVGDFNDTPLSYAVNTLSHDLNNSFVEKGSGWGITYNGTFPHFQIDYVLSSKNFSVQHFQILKKQISDHYAIWSDLQL